MKLEKVNDHQIRCTLTKSDLADRQLKLSELAYGTEKAKSLFRDMMQQAAYEFGFEAEDIPLMIEAIPLSSESIVLIITKVEDPEELDTRFSNFAPSVKNGMEGQLEELLKSMTDNPDNVLDLFKKLKADQTKATPAPVAGTAAKSTIAEQPQAAIPADYLKAFSFDSLDDISRLAKLINKVYKGKNSLYKDNKNKKYILVITKSENSDSDFNKICNMISEYGSFERFNHASAAFLEEEGCLLIKDDAINKMMIE
ncbi:MAG: adaptor protein MecA [Lachnospiraceae bacterium]|nr:adaptor protein MecA [Lachnospiraceae bacterium]